MFKELYNLTHPAEKKFILSNYQNELVLEAGVYNDGLITLFDEDYASKIDLSNWTFLIGEGDFIAVGCSGIGDLFLYKPISSEFYIVETQSLVISNLEISIKDFFNHFLCQPNIISDVLNREYFSDVRNFIGYSLNYGQTFILKPHTVLGGNDIPENYTTGDTSVYLEITSQTVKQSNFSGSECD